MWKRMKSIAHRKQCERKRERTICFGAYTVILFAFYWTAFFSLYCDRPEKKKQTNEIYRCCSCNCCCCCIFWAFFFLANAFHSNELLVLDMFFFTSFFYTIHLVLLLLDRMVLYYGLKIRFRLEYIKSFSCYWTAICWYSSRCTYEPFGWWRWCRRSGTHTTTTKNKTKTDYK